MNESKWLELMMFITALATLIHLFHLRFIKLSWCWHHSPLPEKCFSPAPGKKFFAEKGDLKHWMWRCNHITALQSGWHQLSQLGHSWGILRVDIRPICEIFHTRPCKGMSSGRLECQVWRQNHNWKVFLPVQGSIYRGMLFSSLCTEYLLNLGTMEHPRLGGG